MHPELGVCPSGSLFDSLPQKIVRRVLSVNHASLAVFAGDKEKAVVALKFKPSDIIFAAPTWVRIIYQVMSDCLRFQIQRVRTVIRDVIVEGGRFLLESAGSDSVHERLAIAFNSYLDGHPA